MRYIIVNKFNGKWVLGWDVDWKDRPSLIFESNCKDPLYFHSKQDAENTAKRLNEKLYIVLEVSKWLI